MQHWAAWVTAPDLPTARKLACIVLAQRLAVRTQIVSVPRSFYSVRQFEIRTLLLQPPGRFNHYCGCWLLLLRVPPCRLSCADSWCAVREMESNWVMGSREQARSTVYPSDRAGSESSCAATLPPTHFQAHLLAPVD